MITPVLERTPEVVVAFVSNQIAAQPKTIHLRVSSDEPSPRENVTARDQGPRVTTHALDTTEPILNAEDDDALFGTHIREAIRVLRGK